MSQPTVSRVLSQGTGSRRTTASVLRLFSYAESTVEAETLPDHVLEQVRSLHSASPAMARALGRIVNALSDLSSEESTSDGEKPNER